MKLFLSLVMIVSLAAPAAGQGFFSSTEAGNSLPDAVDVRSSLKSSITASAWTARRLPSRIFTSETAPGRVSFRVMTQNDAFYLLLTNEYGSEFPLYSAGSYIIKRDLSDGSYVQAKIFLKNDPDSFLRITPFGDRSRLEIYLYGTLIYRDVMLPRTFEELLFSPFSRLVSLSGGRVDWNLIFPSYLVHDNPVPSMIARLRDAVPGLPDMDDGAMDDSGRFIYIESGERSRAGGFNCSGFVKYISDGLYLPRQGKLMPVEPLKRKHLELRGNSWTEQFEDERDPFFGLDWIRNIAVTLGGIEEVDPEDYDVRSVPHLSYIEDVGYRIEELETLLYLLALESPGDFYLASVNAEFGEDPPLLQHIHVVALFPFLTSEGDLRTAVFERNRETSLTSLANRYPDDHIHLVRIRGSHRFELPALSAEGVYKQPVIP